MSCSFACTNRSQRSDCGEGSGETHPFVKFRHLHGDGLRLLVPLQLVESCLLLDDLAQDEGKQFLVVACLREVLAESLLRHKSSISRALLCDECKL